MKLFDDARVSPKHWDLVLTCFESVTRVTGGIGTYTNLLLKLLGSRLGTRHFNILFLTAERARHDDWATIAPTVYVGFVPEKATIDGAPLNNLWDPYRHFSYGVMHTLQHMAELGHTFGTIEFPDYSAEGYFTLKARRFGLLAVERIAVRLHSPLLMLHEDNKTMAQTDNQSFRFHDEERFTYQAADVILYGGDAMLKRVTSLVGPALAKDMRDKAVKVPHPWAPGVDLPRVRKWPTLVRKTHFAYIGRLEYRKGVDLLIGAALKYLEEDANVIFHFFGKDTDTFRGGSMKAYLIALIPAMVRKQFIFHDAVPQAELWSEFLPRMDAFVFPSRFENYPNVLLEALSFHKPVLVSKHGCMPEMGAPFSNVASFDPFNLNDGVAAIRKVCDGKLSNGAPETYAKVQQAITEKIVTEYRKLTTLVEPTLSPRRKKKDLGVSFVVAHYNHADLLEPLFASLRPQLQAGDEVIVVDDCSRPAEARRARAIVARAGFTFIGAPENGGPSAARNLGIQASKNPLISIVDSDDELEKGSVQVLRRAMTDHADIDVIAGFMKCFHDEHHAWAAYDPIIETILQENSCHCGIMARKSVLQGIGGYQEELRTHLEDWEINMRLVLSGARFEIVPILAYRYRVNKSTGRNSVHQELLGYSYEAAVRSALRHEGVSKVDPEQLVRTLVALACRRAPPAPPPSARELRYKLADRLNLALKRTPLHNQVKDVFELVLDPRVVKKPGARRRKLTD